MPRCGRCSSGAELPAPVSTPPRHLRHQRGAGRHRRRYLPGPTPGAEAARRLMPTSSAMAVDALYPITPLELSAGFRTGLDPAAGPAATGRFGATPSVLRERLLVRRARRGCRSQYITPAALAHIWPLRSAGLYLDQILPLPSSHQLPLPMPPITAAYHADFAKEHKRMYVIR